MSGIFGGSKSSPSASPVTSLRLQTSTRGRPIPLAYGKPRLAANLIWYGDLVATAHQQSNGGKGGGGNTSTTTYTYVAAVIMALCEGAVNAIPRVWRQKEVFSGLPATGLLQRVQDETFTIPNGLVVTVANAAAFSANVSVSRDDFSRDSVWRNGLTLGADYTVASGVYTFSSAWRGAQVYITYDYVSSISAQQDACAQLNLGLVNGTYAQSALGWMTTKHPAEALAYHGVAYVAGSTYALTDNADLNNHSFEVDTQFGYSSTIRDANPKDVIIDLLTNPYYGAGFPASKLGSSSLYSKFCVANNIFISPAYLEQVAVREMLTTLMKITNAGIVYSEGQLKLIPLGDIAATANGVTFTPNITPVYDLTDDDFLGDAGSDPISVSRKPNSDAYNCVRIKFYNRANNYNEEIVEAKDQANIELYGLRAMDVLDVKELCDATAARSVAQLMLQRALYIRNTFEFRLGWSKALLEPVDLVTLTDAGMGMNKTPVRILTIEEDEYGELTVTAEEFPLNVCNAATYNTQPPIGYAANFNVAPGNVTTPCVFEAPIELATSNDYLDIWIAVGGGANYGGCEAWLSLDNATYKRVGRVDGKSRYGNTTAILSSQFAPGIAAQSLPVSLLAGGQLLSGTLTDANLLNTLCYVGGEFMAYQTSTLTGANAYTLSTLNRGVYGSGQIAHASGESFVRIDDQILKIALTQDYIGKTIYLKLLAFNPFGGALQALADVAAVPYSVTGRFVRQPPPDMPTFSVTVKPGGTRQFSFNAAGAPKDVMNGGGYRIKYRTAGSGIAWAAMTTLHDGLISQSPYESNNPPAGAYDFAIVEVDKLGNESNAPLLISAAVLGNEPVAYGAAANMLANSDWQISTGSNVGAGALYGWKFSAGSMTAIAGVGRNYQSFNPGRGGAWWADDTNIGLLNNSFLYQDVPVVAGVVYELSALVNPARCMAFIFVSWLNSSGAVISQTASSGFDGGSSYIPANSLTAMKLLWLSATAPAGAVAARFTAYKQATNTGNTNSYVFFNRALMCIARPGVTQATATPWIEAGVDTFHGGGLASLSVGTPNIAQFAATDSITVYPPNLDVWVGAPSAVKIQISSITYTALNDCECMLYVITTARSNAAAVGNRMDMGVFTSVNGYATNGCVYQAVNSATFGSENVAKVYRFNVVAGSTTTFYWLGAGGYQTRPGGGVAVFEDNTFRLEVIKK